MAEELANFAKTTLNGAIDGDDTSLVITSATNFPSSGNFRLLIQDSESDITNRELMLVGARSGTTLSSITRGIESTSGVSHGNNSFVAVVLTRGSLLQVLDDAATLGISGEEKYNPDAHPPSSNAVTDEFDDGSLNAAWTWTTAPTSPGTTDESTFKSYLVISGQTANNDRKLRRTYQPGASTAFTVASKIIPGLQQANVTYEIGLGVLDSSDNIIARVLLHSDGTSAAVSGRRLSFGATTIGGADQSSLITPIYLRLTRDTSNNYAGHYSPDGIVWTQIATSSSGTTVDRVAITYNTPSSSLPKVGVDFVRVFDSVTEIIGDDQFVGGAAPPTSPSVAQKVWAAQNFR